MVTMTTVLHWTFCHQRAMTISILSNLCTGEAVLKLITSLLVGCINCTVVYCCIGRTFISSFNFGYILVQRKHLASVFFLAGHHSLMTPSVYHSYYNNYYRNIVQVCAQVRCVLPGYYNY